MVSRYGGRKEPTMHCFMSHCAHPPPQHPPPPLSQFRIISAANAARPDVSFHVSGAGFPQQQGGGGGPPSGPQLRGIPHPHGNPAIPPPHQQQAPPQGTTQHTGGPTGPAPTSTPPGPADMGKQGPPHMQGQPQMQQGGQMQLNYQSRPAGSQPFFAGGPRGPTPRMPNHNRPVVNMQANNVGQQMFSQHMQMPQMPLYSQPVVPAPVQPVYMPGHVFGTQPRQNHGTSAYYQPSPPQQLLVTPQIYSSFHNPAAQPGTQYYYSQSPVSLSRAGGGVTGAPGPGGIPGPASQQVMAGGPPTQLGQPGGPVGLGLVPGTVSVSGLTPADASTGQTSGMGKQTRRKHALDIVDPKTMKNVDIYEGSGTSSTTPPRSGESSARETPQPNTGPGAMDVAAEFAARVAKAAASEKSPSPPPPSIPPQGAPTYIDTSSHDGPDASGTNIVIASEEISTNSVVTQSEAPPISKQQIIVVEDANLVASSGSGVMGALPSWKQSTQLSQPASTAISVKQPNNSSSKSELISSGQSAEEEKEALVKTDSDLMPLETGVAPQEKIAPFTVSAVKDSETTPVVSAKVNAPTVELVHSNREQFPALKSNASHQSPRRKPQTQTQIQSHPASQTTAATVNPPASSPHASRESTPLIESRGPKKVTQVEEPVSTVPVAVPPPKEKRDSEKQTRGREKSSSVSSQGSRGEREKSASSQSLGRDQDKSSQLKNKDTSNSKEREKPSLQGREKPSASPTAATLPPASPVVTVQPDIQAPTKAAPVTEEPKQQANGETAVVDNSIDGKANQRSKQQRNKHQKMRDNRKGTEKGSDMDAFVETPSEEAAPAPTPSAPPAPSSGAVPLTPVPPTATTMTNKEVDNQVAKEEEIDIDKEEKLVAARNEENTKVSAAALKEQENPTPVIESIPNPKPAITLRHTYPEDQWSPINPEGKRKYERDFLMELQNDPQSKKKPENFPLPDILRDNSNRQRMADRSSLGGARMPVHTGFDNFTPGFIKSPQSKGQVPAKRKSQQGTNPKQNKQNVILSLSLREDVKLHETENAWRPGRMQQKNISDDQAKTDELYKKVRGVLNKLTPQKFNTLVNQVQSLPIDSSDRLEGVIKLVFEKAVDEPSFSVAYAQMCKVLATIQVPAEKKKKDDPEELVNFRKLLVNRCQAEFEKNSEVELNRGAKLKEIEDTTDPEKKKELQMTFQEEERKLRMKSVGNIRFIGELFKLGMLTTNIMHRCIRELLLHDTDEESLECLCKLLTTIGKDLEIKQQDLSSYFQKMKDISGKRGSVSSRVRFMLQDVIELRQNKWVPRRDDSNPKTMEQIQKEAEKESLDSQIALNSAPPTPRRQDDRTPLNRKNRQGTGEDGWSVASSRRYIDTTKLKPQKDDNKEVRLGTPGQFSSWVTGASVRKDPKQARDTGGGGGGGGVPYGNNYFTVLQDSSADDSKRPPVSLSGRGPGKSAPSASIEKDRSSAPYKAGEGNRQSRSSSSRSSSRDNSALRGGDEPSLRPSATLSQPPSISASTEDISMVPGRPGTKSPSAVSPLSEQEVISRTHTLLDEFFNNNNLKESELTVAETFAQENLRVFVRESLNSSLERSSSNRQNAGKLLSHLVKCNVISLSQYLSGLSEYLDIADDLEIDVPKFWLYTAEMIVPMLSSEVIPFSKLHDIAPPSQNGKLICEVLHLLNKDQGPGWIREKWDAAGLKWNVFLPENKIDSFIKEKKLEFTVGGALPTSSSDEINWNSVQEKLCQFLSPNQATSPTFDMICDWIGANVGTCVKESQFIRALTTAVCQSSICAQNKLNENHFAQQQRLLVKYVDNQEPLELQCLYAIQALMNQMQHPQGLLCQIFQSLWDNSTISSESFIAWENSTDPAEQAGKGVASKSLTSFYTALREGEEDSSCEES